MKKDNVRDYATEAFRFYALVSSHKKEISTEAERNDYDAVSETLVALSEGVSLSDAEGIVRHVYMTDPQHRIQRGQISARVVSATFKYGLQERAIYKILAKARMIFAVKRGLRID